jgi:translation initiation factor IF-3
MAHTELGRRLLERLATDISELAQVDSPARQDGRNMIAVFSPRKSAITAPRSAHQAGRAAPGQGRGSAARGGQEPARATAPPADQATTRTAPVSAP